MTTNLGDSPYVRLLRDMLITKLRLSSRTLPKTHIASKHKKDRYKLKSFYVKEQK